LVEELLTFQPNPILRDQLLTVIPVSLSFIRLVVQLHEELAVFQNKIGKRNAGERNGVAFQRREIGIEHDADEEDENEENGIENDDIQVAITIVSSGLETFGSSS
jgi:hypothetical protein